MLTFLMIEAFAVGYLKRYNVFGKLLHIEKEVRISKLPKVCHRVLHFGEKIRRVLFVGDVHGCCDELIELLEVCGVNEGNEDTFVVFAGDIVNKGPKNIETARLVRSLGEMALSVRGNHEEAVLSRLQKHRDSSTELPRRYSWITDLSAEDQKFLEEFPFTISIPLLNVIVVHGGLVPGVRLQEQDPQNMISMRNYIHDELSGTADIDKGVAWGSQWPGPEFVIYGHDARRRLQKYRNALGLDTGCVYGGMLTGFLVQLDDKDPLKSGQLMSVHANKSYAVS